MSDVFQVPGPHDDEELYQRLLYLAYVIHMEKEYMCNIRSTRLIEEWKRFRDSEDVKIHCGDCTKVCCPCPRCMLQAIEVDAENMYIFLRTLGMKELKDERVREGA
jgi:hypothetical protein